MLIYCHINYGCHFIRLVSFLSTLLESLYWIVIICLYLGDKWDMEAGYNAYNRSDQI